MAKNRENLQLILEEILGSRNVYFQPPESLKLKYPCIVYERSDIRKDHADNNAYHTYKQYTVTVIDEDPDSELPDKLIELQFCKFNRHFVSDNLNHDVFDLFY